MSLKKNVLASYASQIYTTLISMVMVPMYVRYLGAETYGLVGFFATLQVMFQLLDIGLTPTISREAARFNGGATDALTLRRLLRALEGIFIGVGILGGGGLVVCAGYISSSWLKAQELPLGEVHHAVVLMAVIVVLRWISGLYRGAVNGFENLVWLSNFNILIATVRFALIIPFFIYVGTTPTAFFTYQLIVAIVEIACLIIKTYRVLPASPQAHLPAWDWQPLRGVLRFSLSIAFTSAVWVFVTQTDKLILSKLLPLSDYAMFTIAVMLAGGVQIISGPISGALMPRLANLHAKGDDAELLIVYRGATQLVSAIAIPATLVLAFFPQQILFAWTGNPDIASKAGSALALYALGNGLLAIRAFPYYLQYAKGDLKLHLIGSSLNVALLIPLLTWATWKFGILGAAYTWLGTNALFFILWTPFLHRRLVKGLHMNWLLKDIAPIFFAGLLATMAFHVTVSWPDERGVLAVYVALVSLVTLAVSTAASSKVMAGLKAYARMRLARQG